MSKEKIMDGKYRITRKMVEWRECKGCLSGYGLRELDHPRKDGSSGWICKDCYINRLRVKEDLLTEQFATIGACIHTYQNRELDTYMDEGERDVYEWGIERHDIMSRCKKDILAILAMKDIEAVKKLHKEYDKERFATLDEDSKRTTTRKGEGK